MKSLKLFEVEVTFLTGAPIKTGIFAESEEEATRLIGEQYSRAKNIGNPIYKKLAAGSGN